LKELGFTERTGRYGQKGAAIRRLKLPDKPLGTPDNPGLSVSDSVSESATLDLESAGFTSQSARFNPESATAIAHNLPLQTCHTDPPSKPVRNADELREGLANAFSKARPDENLNWAGFADIEHLAAEFGNETILKVWRHWLKTRDTGGMKFHFQWFRTEFHIKRADLERIEREKKAQKKLWDAAIAADDAQYEREREALKLKWAEEKTEAAKGPEGLFG